MTKIEDTDDIPFNDDDDPLGEYREDVSEAANKVIACFDAVAKMVGEDGARYLFAETLKAHPAVKGRPPKALTVEDLEFLSAVHHAPRGQKIATASALSGYAENENGTEAENTQKRLQRLRNAWRALDPVSKQALTEDWILSKQPRPDGRSVSEVFGAYVAHGDKKAP